MGFNIISRSEPTSIDVTWEQAIYQNIEQFRESGKSIVVGKIGNTEEELSSFKQVYENLIQQILVNTDGSDLQKVLFLHNYLLSNIEYPNLKLLENENNLKFPVTDYENKTERNYASPYGALINKKAMCEGIAQTVNLVLNDPRINVPSQIVSAFSLSNHGKVGHSWNIVHIDGIPYQLDTTHDITKNSSSIKRFNDPSKVFEDVEHEIAGAKATRFSDVRFLENDEQFLKDHIWQGEKGIEYPKCPTSYSRQQINIAIEELKGKGVKFDYDSPIRVYSQTQSYTKNEQEIEPSL